LTIPLHYLKLKIQMKKMLARLKIMIILLIHRQFTKKGFLKKKLKIIQEIFYQEKILLLMQKVEIVEKIFQRKYSKKFQEMITMNLFIFIILWLEMWKHYLK
jgi:hypothetical protein